MKSLISRMKRLENEDSFLSAEVNALKTEYLSLLLQGAEDKTTEEMKNVSNTHNERVTRYRCMAKKSILIMSLIIIEEHSV